MSHDHDHDHSSHPLPWAPVLGGVFIVNICTLVGVAILAIPSIHRASERERMTTLASGFAAGTLLSVAFLLMLPEALISISEGSFTGAMKTADDHADHAHEPHRRLSECEIHEMLPVAVVWRWGALILAGFGVVFALDLVVDVTKAKVRRGITSTPAAAAGAEKVQTAKTVDKARDGECAAEAAPPGARRMLFVILIGDAMHNFVDGIWIGTAFLFCSSSVGWTVIAGTIAHEVSSELSDFLLLTTVCGLRVWQALALNFLSGVTIFFGAIAVLAADLDASTAGMLLAAGGGLFIYNGAVECLPRVLATEVLAHKLQAFGLCAVGAVAIGLVLMDHEHCE